MSSETVASTMKQEATNALVPKLRFPEFRGLALRSVLLGAVTEECRSRNGSKHSVSSVMGVTKADGIVPMETRLIAADIARYKLVETDWFAYNPMRLNIGSIARWEGEREILVSPDYVVFKCITDDDSGCAPGYLDQFRKTKAWEAFVTEGGDGSVRVRIYYKDIARIALVLPPLPEQQRIADCLSSLDELIAAQAQKVEALKTHKKGLMQQLFPRAGETQPRLRFPEFQNAGEWEATTLGEYIGPIRNGFVGTATPYYTSSVGVPYLQGKNVKGGRIDASNLVFITTEFHVRQKKSHLKTGDILMVQSGHVGECAVVGADYEGCNCHALVILSPSRKLNSEFFVHYFYSPVGELAIFQITTGNTIKHILASELKTLPVLVPKPAEQQRIAFCLSNLDALITAENQKLDALKTHKKGLMQKLFPALGLDES
jgi:type I restriction enzyme S subunit